MLTVAAVVAGFLLDALLGDPRRIPHPIVAMGNAIAAVRQAADDVTGTNDADGVAEYLEKRLL